MEQLRVQWREFPASLAGALGQLQHCGELADVTLACEGRRIHAHKLVLSACSPYFRDAFKENPCHHPIIILKDVQAQDILNLLSYMYQGEVDVEESKLSSFIQTAELLQIKGLSPAVVTQVKKQPQPKKNVAARLTISKKIFPSKDEAPKRRRNSATERLTSAAAAAEPPKKVKKDKSHTTKKVESFDSKLTKPANDHADTAENNPPVTVLEPPNIEIKHEIEDPPDMEEIDDDDESLDNSQSPSPPLYESSMLARSLLSGVHALKNDQNSGGVAVNKSILSNQLSISTVAAPNRDCGQTSSSTVTKYAATAEDGFVKTEKMSPRSDVMELEPEVLISEQEESLVSTGRSGATTSKNHVQRANQAGTSNSQQPLPPFNQTNHAAICGDCPHCGKKYSNQSALKYHVRLMHSDLTNRLCCYLCPQSFTMRDTFKEHMWSSHGQRN